MHAQAHRSSTTTAAIDLAATSLLFGATGEKACGWFDSSLELRQGLQVSELSYDSHNCLAAWPELTRNILGQSMLNWLNPARFSYAAGAPLGDGRHIHLEWQKAVIG